MAEISREEEKAPLEIASFQQSSFLQGAISVFILFHLIAITCWALPFNLFVIKDVKEFVRPYMLWAGLFQSWDTFAPEPKSINSYLEAVAITQSHKQKVWVFPRMEQLSYGERYREERYRKFAEVLPQRQLSAMWPDVAQHVTRLFDDPSDPPAMILLIQFQAPIQPWAKANAEPAPKPNIFYEYVNSVRHLSRLRV
ncbi:MAG TPA: hypothetical protein VN670_01550 [Acidobacteriaceae bacterium]|nr:hypothetical protein [Acidobacteriaceae bacterium]